MRCEENRAEPQHTPLHSLRRLSDRAASDEHMPRYTFTAPDHQFSSTVDLRDDDAAWAEAILFTAQMLREVDGKLPSHTDWQISVTNEGDQPVAMIRIQAQRYFPLG
jgi:hypothetical protein